jgi:hypothetical protein
VALEPKPPLAAPANSGHTQGVAEMPPNRVFIADARGGNQYLRATWHPESATVVFSHWDGEVCMASTPVALTDSATLIDLMVRALSQVAERRLPPVAPPMPQSVFERLRNCLRPKLADVIDARARFHSVGRRDTQKRQSSQP